MNLPDPDVIPIDQVPRTVLFPREAMGRIFFRKDSTREPDFFGAVWELPERKKYSYVFMTRELLNLLWGLKSRGVARGIWAEFGCSPWPATNIWYEDPESDSLFDEARYALTETYWGRCHEAAFEVIQAGQLTLPQGLGEITRLLVDYHFNVHLLARELPDHPVTAEMDLRAFNSEKDLCRGAPEHLHIPAQVGLRAGTDSATMARLRRLNELSLASARKRALERLGADVCPGEPFIHGAVLSSLFNYIPWKAFLKKLDEHLLPGGLLVVYNAQEGERQHLDWQNLAEDQESITAFIQNDLGYALRIHELRSAGGVITPLYLVAQKKSPGAL